MIYSTNTVHELGLVATDVSLYDKCDYCCQIAFVGPTNEPKKQKNKKQKKKNKTKRENKMS